MEPVQPKGEEGREPSGQKGVRADQVPTHTHTRSSLCFCPVLSLFSFLSEAPYPPLQARMAPRSTSTRSPSPYSLVSQAHRNQTNGTALAESPNYLHTPPSNENFQPPLSLVVFIREQNLATYIWALCGVLQPPWADFPYTSLQGVKTQNESRSGGGAQAVVWGRKKTANSTFKAHISPQNTEQFLCVPGSKFTW